MAPIKKSTIIVLAVIFQNIFKPDSRSNVSQYISQHFTCLKWTV